MQALIQYGDLIGTLVFAVTGGLAAAEKRLDFGGFFVLAFVTGVGGGTMRDVVLGRDGVFWADQPEYIVLCLAGALGAFLWGVRLERLRWALVWGDALGLAVFSVIGAGIAVQAGAPALTSILMGALTATGGGVLREIIRNELPLVLRRDVYISAALAGAGALVGLHELGAPAEVSVVAGVVVAFALRAAGITWDLHLPVYRGRRGGSDGASDAPADAS